MGIRVALNHVTKYTYDRPVTLMPHVVRLRPAPHARTPVVSYSLSIEPTPHFLNWQQDPFSNHLASTHRSTRSNTSQDWNANSPLTSKRSRPGRGWAS